ncbi:MAG: hypothetical protein GTO24_21850 [candidate division Zixibacteria bacterium]|nr:hypothetical protein [candidate division Zixibacteria bacterium]
MGVIMFLLRSFTEGISNVWANRFLIGLMYLFKLGSSLVLLFPLYVMFSASFGRNVKASNLLSGFDLSLVIDFVYCWRKTLPIYLATLVLVCVIVVLAFIFLSGGFWGILRDGAKKREESPVMERFFGYCGKYFWGMFKIAILLSVFYFFAFFIFLFCSVILDAVAGKVSLWELTSARMLGQFLIGLLLFFFVNMVGDYLRISLIENPAKRFFRIVGRAIKFVLTNATRTLSLYYSLSLVSAAAIFIYLELTEAMSAMPPTGILILITFLIQQGLVIFSSFYRLVYYSSQLVLFDSLSRAEAYAT